MIEQRHSSYNRDFSVTPYQAGGRSSWGYGNTRLEPERSFFWDWAGIVVGGFVVTLMIFAWIS